MSNYHFEKPTIPEHTLLEQLKAFKAKLAKRDKAWKEAFADTLPTAQAPFDDDDLDEVTNPKETP